MPLKPNGEDTQQNTGHLIERVTKKRGNYSLMLKKQIFSNISPFTVLFCEQKIQGKVKLTTPILELTRASSLGQSNL